MPGRHEQYPPELRERAVRLVAECRPDHASEWEAMRSVAQKLGIGTTETVRKWVRRAEVDAGAQRDPQGGSGFLRGRARPATPDLVKFVAEHADRTTVDGLRWGVEPICRVLCEHGTPIAPNTFYDARTRRSDRAVRDEQLKAEISRIWDANYGVYGARKVWLPLNYEQAFYDSHPAQQEVGVSTP
jgi:transposase-like protein